MTYQLTKAQARATARIVQAARQRRDAELASQTAQREAERGVAEERGNHAT
jgi:hypothetical protein